MGALCCNSGRGVAIGTATEIVALQHQHSGVHQGRTGAGLSVKVITVRYHPLRREFSLTEGPAPGPAVAWEVWPPLSAPVRGRNMWLMAVTSVSHAGWQSLFTDRAIERFAEEVCVAGVAGSLLDEVQQHPPEREVPSVTQRPGR